MNAFTSFGIACGLTIVTFTNGLHAPASPSPEKEAIELGNFSVSLAVKDIKASKAFYDKLGFKVAGGKIEQDWIILQNATATIGLFQGMFPNNVMTFNPGWNRDKETLEEFQDVRVLQGLMKGQEIKLVLEADPDSDGPAHFVMVDPDGNSIFVDQHVPRPKDK
jgi:catechol 2,3-dioxygenase-like lactoylglutathione lyase family enzyme